MKKFLFLVALVLVGYISTFSQAGDAALRAVTEKDRSSRGADGRLTTLAAAEHLARGRVYFDNRQFKQAREHFQKIIDTYPRDEAMSGALFMTGRSFYWEKDYTDCIPWLDRAFKEYPSTKDGRESLYFDASCNLRVGRNDQAAKLWQQYAVMYPKGERVENAYVNSIDALREAGRYKEADEQVDKTRQLFPGTATETNALHARLRMQIFRGRYSDAEATAAVMQAQAKFAGSLTSLDEIKYLRAFALERQNKKAEAMAMYGAISQSPNSYYGWLASDKLGTTGMTRAIAQVSPSDFPAAFKSEVLAASRPRKIDPRFILSLMRQESSFKPDARSAAAARGLLQLTIDTAGTYKVKAGYAGLQAEDLYDPRTNITIACEYIAELQRQFGGFYEAIAASYNGSEDNAARWLSHTKPKDPGIYASEVGFAETKSYVFKVMASYRIYKQLYDEDLNRR